jgi:hypothetical protein
MGSRGIKVSGWFVSEQDLWFIREGSRNGDTLLFSS